MTAEDGVFERDIEQHFVLFLTSLQWNAVSFCEAAEIMEILLFGSQERDVRDQRVLTKTASNRIKEKQKNTEENKGNYWALRNAFSHLWRGIQHSLVRQGKTLNWFELEANKLLWVCSVHTPRAQGV